MCVCRKNPLHILSILSRPIHNPPITIPIFYKIFLFFLLILKCNFFFAVLSFLYLYSITTHWMNIFSVVCTKYDFFSVRIMFQDGALLYICGDLVFFFFGRSVSINSIILFLWENVTIQIYT